MKSFLIIFIFFSFFILFNPTRVLAYYDFEFYSGLTEAGEEIDSYKDDLADVVEISLPQKIGAVLGAILSFVGVIFLVLMIYGGILWMTTAGNEEQTGKAKKIIASAVIGLVIVASAYAVTTLVGGILK